jgi:hypothetical protein
MDRNIPTGQPMPEKRIDNQSMAEGEIGQQEIPGNAYQQPIPEKKGSKKGCIISIIVIILIIALLATAISLAVGMILNAIRNNQEDSQVESEAFVVEEVEEGEIEGGEIEISEWQSPFNLEVWDSPELVQIELGGVVLDVPIPPNAVIDEDTGDYTVFIRAEDNIGDDWFLIQVILRNMMESDFGEYFAEESLFNVEWHNEWAEILDMQEFEEQDVGLMITHWDAGFHEGYTFTKISQYQDVVLLVEIRFESANNQEEFFEVYGFMDSFEEIIRSTLTDILSEETDTTQEQTGFDSPEDAVIAFLEGLRG